MMMIMMILRDEKQQSTPRERGREGGEQWSQHKSMIVIDVWERTIPKKNEQVKWTCNKCRSSSSRSKILNIATKIIYLRRAKKYNLVCVFAFSSAKSSNPIVHSHRWTQKSNRIVPPYYSLVILYFYFKTIKCNKRSLSR